MTSEEIKERARAEATRILGTLPGCTTCVEAVGIIARLTRERDEARAEAQAMGLRAVAAEAKVKVLAASATDETEARHALRARIADLESALREAGRTARGIAHANRFDREAFDDAAAFADWAQSRARRAATKIEAALTPTKKGGRDA